MNTVDRFLNTIAIIFTISISSQIIPADVVLLTSFGDESDDERKISSGTINRIRPETQNGIDAARKALQNEKCAVLFGDLSNDGFRSAIDLLDTYVNNNLMRDGISDASGSKFKSAGIGAITIAGMGSFRNAAGASQSASVITINLKGFYFSNQINDGSHVTAVKGGGFEGLDMAGVRGAVILHELLHAVGRIPDDHPTILNDGGKRSMANAELVRKSCFLR